MKSRRWKWVSLAAAGSITGSAILYVFRSIPIAAGTASAMIVAVIILKHLALALVVGSPLTAILQNLKSNIRPHCPFAGP
jgi:hypothetical protein